MGYLMNKKWLKLALGILCIIFVYFALFYKLTDPDDYCAKIDKITDAFVKDMHKKHGLVCYGKGGSCMDNIKRISLSLKKAVKSDIPESRVLLVNCVEEFLKRVNTDEDVRPFLVQYPFTNENIEISIVFKGPEQIGDQQDIIDVFNMEERVIYYGYDKTHNKEKVMLREPYEEALKIVKESGRLDGDMSNERVAS